MLLEISSLLKNLSYSIYLRNRILDVINFVIKFEVWEQINDCIKKQFGSTDSIETGICGLVTVVELCNINKRNLCTSAQ